MDNIPIELLKRIRTVLDSCIPQKAPLVLNYDPQLQLLVNSDFPGLQPALRG